MTAAAPAEREAYLMPVPFTRLLRAEWRKTTDTRAARWLLAATALTTIGGLAVPLAFPYNVAQTRASYLLWAGLGLSRLLPIALMLAMTAEWSQRTALTTFTLTPAGAGSWPPGSSPDSASARPPAWLHAEPPS